MRVVVGLALCVVVASCIGGDTVRGSAAMVGGDAERGRVMITVQGCGACHVIPGVRGARGVLGPPLEGFAQRSFIAGELPNSPKNLVQWIMNPHEINPRTAMPDLDIDEQQARDIASFLYTLD